jgi:hypothetical protein
LRVLAGGRSSLKRAWSSVTPRAFAVSGQFLCAFLLISQTPSTRISLTALLA